MIHCFGNSHINTFSNKSYLSYESNDIFKLYHLGPTIAYNFYNNHYNKVLSLLPQICKNEYVSLILGEVDCRLHIPKQADIQNRTDEDVVKEVVDRMFLCYDDIIKNGYCPIVFSTHPTTKTIDLENADYIYGDMYRRNNICVLWNNYCEYMCNLKNIPFVSFYSLLVNDKNETFMEYFLDYCHINSSLIYTEILKPLTELGIA